MTELLQYLFVGICPSAGLCRSKCECPQCSADDSEDYAIYRWDAAKEDELWRRYRQRPLW